MSNATADLVGKLNTATIWINHIYPVLQIVFGTFGNVFNIILFTRPALRTNPCSMYFLAGSVNNCFVIYGALLPRYLASSWNLDPSATNPLLCKLRNFFTYVTLTLALWFTVLASIDRFLSSSHSVRFRRMSNLSVARKLIVVTILLISLSYVHVPIYFGTAMTGPVISCIFSPYEYIVFLSFFGPFASFIFPVAFMSIFGTLMIINVRQIGHRVAPQNHNARNERLHANDRQLIIMLLFQVLITTLISAPYFVLALYNVVALTILGYRLSASGQAIYNLAFNLFRLLYYTNPILSFYIYTLTGPKFRVEMKRCTGSGLRTVLSVTGLAPCLPLRARQALLGQNPTGTNDAPGTLSRRGLAIHPVQNNRPMNNILAR